MSKAGLFFTFPDKLGALALLGKWCGWEKGTVAENKAADALGTMVRRRAHRARPWLPGLADAPHSSWLVHAQAEMATRLRAGVDAGSNGMPVHQIHAVFEANIKGSSCL